MAKRKIHPFVGRIAAYSSKSLFRHDMTKQLSQDAAMRDTNHGAIYIWTTSSSTLSPDVFQKRHGSGSCLFHGFSLRNELRRVLLSNTGTGPLGENSPFRRNILGSLVFLLTALLFRSSAIPFHSRQYQLFLGHAVLHSIMFHHVKQSTLETKILSSCCSSSRFLLLLSGQKGNNVNVWVRTKDA